MFMLHFFLSLFTNVFTLPSKTKHYFQFNSELPSTLIVQRRLSRRTRNCPRFDSIPRPHVAVEHVTVQMGLLVEVVQCSAYCHCYSEVQPGPATSIVFRHVLA